MDPLFIDLIQFLKSEGFTIPETKLERFYTYIGYTQPDLFKNNTIIRLMQTFFCETPDQYLQLSDLCRMFFEDREKRKKKTEEKKRLAKAIGDHQKEFDLASDQIRTTEEKIQELNKKIEKEHLESRKRLFEEVSKKQEKILTTKQENLFRPNQRKLSALFGNDPVGKKLKGILDGNYIQFTEQDIPLADRRIMDIAGKTVRTGNIQMMNVLKELQKALKKAQKALQNKKDILNGTLPQSPIEKELLKEKAVLQRTLRAEQEEKRKIEEQIANILRNMKEIEKSGAKTHRTEMILPHNAVRTLSNMEEPAGLDKNFGSLTEQEKMALEIYLRDNLLQFRTVMNRRLHTTTHRTLDIKKTVQECCKTGGVPVNLIYKKPHPNRAKLILILDVSGSCKKASEMMLMFMNMLASLFPGGCDAYGFVNSIYDISGLLGIDDSHEAVKSVLETIPSRGVYSNYDKPLRQLEENYRHKFTKDSIVIWMGDYRNNKNPSGEEAFKDLSRKVKKCFLLNTDVAAKWNQGDSIVATYQKYANSVYETINTKGIIDFIAGF